MSKRFKSGTGFGSRSNPIVIDASPARRRKTRVVAVTTKAPRRQGITPSLSRQLKALISAKKRDAADVAQNFATPASGTLSTCLTSSQGVTATAPSSTGLMDTDADEVMINHVRIFGNATNVATLDLDPASGRDVNMRTLVVWFNKPLQVAVPAGSLPPITEVLVTDSINSMPVTDAANGGRFKILSDKTINLGTNTYQAATAVGHARIQGRTNQRINYTVKVGRMCKFKAPAASGASTAGGHYDSDVSAGQIDRGLLVMYVLSSDGGNGAVPTQYVTTRLNYTG